MRALLPILLLSLPLCAQEAAKPAEQAKPEEKKEAAAAPQGQTAAPAAGAGDELSWTGSVDVGYRWVTTGGSFQTYRSIINLGAGPKLFGADATFLDPKRRLFDRLDVRATDWGGDPYNTILVSARKMGVYDFRADYRNFIYYNFEPSFADPTAPFFLLNQRAYDIHKRITDIQLDLRPGQSIIPYLAYGRNSNSGRGITTFSATNNEYPVTNLVRDSLDNYRGGLRFEMRRWHLTLEEGGTVLKDDQQVFTNNFNPGNNTTPFLGQQLFLTSLRQAYGIRGNSTYSRVLASGNPFPWLSLYGQYIYSQPKTDVNYSQTNTGNFVTFEPLLFFGAEVALATGGAKMPHTSANLGFEMRPLKRLRIIETWMTDRLHNAPFGLLTDRLLGGTAGTAGTVLTTPALIDHLVMNYNQQQIDAFYDLTKWFTVRGGYRYVWGNAVVPPTDLTPAGERREERRNVGIAGVMFRISRKIQANAEFEGASSNAVYFRTSLNNYQWFRSQIRYQATTNLRFGVGVNVMNNENPIAGVTYDFLNLQTTFSVFWTPNGGKRVNLLGEYSRSAYRNHTIYLEPSTLAPVPFLYRDNANTANALLEVALPSIAGRTPKFSFGGSLFRSSGSRPTSFYQPVGRLAIPFHKNVAWVNEYRYHGYGEPFFNFEGFRAHLFTTGLRFSR